MSRDLPGNETAPLTRSSGCEEHDRLLDEFGVAVREILKLHGQQFLAAVGRNSEPIRFDLLDSHGQ